MEGEKTRGRGEGGRGHYGEDWDWGEVGPWKLDWGGAGRGMDVGWVRGDMIADEGGVGLGPRVSVEREVMIGHFRSMDAVGSEYPLNRKERTNEQTIHRLQMYP